MKLPVLKAARTPTTMDDLLSRVVDREWHLPFLPSAAVDEPAVDVYRQNGTLVVKAAMPGAKPEEIQASIEGDLLTLRRTYEEAKEEKEKDYYYKEQRSGSFYRQVQLPDAVDADKIEAHLKDGVLTVIAPVSSTIAAKQIKIVS
jgi:HSP20 family protein